MESIFVEEISNKRMELCLTLSNDERRRRECKSIFPQTITEVSLDLDGEQMMLRQYHIQKKLIRGDDDDADKEYDDFDGKHMMLHAAISYSIFRRRS